jgi:hypothetical protein
MRTTGLVTSVVFGAVATVGTVLLAQATAAPVASRPARPEAPAPPGLMVDGQRPAPAALRLGQDDLLARFTPEVRANRKLRERALALWQAHFAANAAEIIRRFSVDEDWRPALAEAATLIDEFLEASLLPRGGAVPAAGSAGNQDDGRVWIETLDPRTEQRTRQLRPAPARPVLFAPEHPEPRVDPESTSKGLPKAD